MKRTGKIAIAAAAILIGLPLIGVATVIVGGNTGPGRRLIERLTPKLSGGTVALSGLAGRFPDALRVAHIAVSDKTGTWLTIDQARLDWSPLSLLHGEARIETLAAAQVAVARLPVSETTTPAKSGGFVLPVSVSLDALQIDKLALAAPLAGAAATVSVNGKAHLASLDDGAVTLDAERLDGAGSYKLDGTITRDTLAAHLNLSEPSHGLLAGLGGLSDLGALSVNATLDGPRNAEKMHLAVSAGPLNAQGQGTIDLPGKTLDIDLTANAPAMTPRPDISWQSAQLDAHLHGPFTSPDATGHLDIETLNAAGAAIGQIKADLQGNSGKLDLTAALAGLKVPGSHPDLFAAAPFQLHATATLNTPQRPVSFTLSHPLLAATGEAQTGGALAATVTLTLPSLTPYAAIGGVDIQGNATLTAKVTQQGTANHFGVDGTIGITGGLPAATALIGNQGKLHLAGTMDGQDIAVDQFTLDGKGLQLSAQGGQKAGVVDLNWKVALSDLSGLAATVAGTVAAHGTLHGPQQNLALTADATGDVATAGLPKEPLTVSLQAQGLPAAPSGKLTAQGRFAGAPLQLAASASRQGDGTLDLTLDRLQWKSASGQGKLSLAPGATVPTGHMAFRLARLDDLAPLTKVAASGSLDATLDTVQVQGQPQARLKANLQHLALNGDSVDRVTVDARIDNPVAHPVLALTLDAQGMRQAAFTGNARLTVNGPQEALALRLSADAQTPQGPARVSAAATARLPKRDLQLSAFQADYGGETTRLLSPAHLTFAPDVSVTGLRLGIGQAVLTASGRIMPTLALSLSAHGITPALAKPFAPGFNGAGTVAFDAKLAGTIAAPEGTLRLTGRGLRMLNGAGGGFPAADLDASATLARNTAHVEAKLNAGSHVHLQIAGTAPLQATSPVDLRISGSTDLTVLDPLLTPSGRIARGQVTLNLSVAGTMAAPRASGTVRLAKASVQDFVQGIHITDLTGLIQAEGDTLRIAQLTGHAGPGTLSVAGTIGAFAPDMPVSLTVTAHNARPLASDLLSATMDAALTLRGQLTGALTLGGEVHVSHANINIPDSFPQGVAVLNVRRAGAKPPPPAPPSQPMALALTIRAPEQIFVRGHGLDAEMGGTLKIAGTAAAPAIAGGFDLRHGTFSLAGQSLTFTTGRVAFGGSGLVDKLDPSLNFVAQSTANDVTATLAITGYADQPKIQLSSSPTLPQDEVLAHLLFGQSVKQLSPFQLAEIAQALASLGGVGGGDPLAMVRNGLGLDRLSVSGATGGGLGATVEAGKYVANGVYVGTKQGTSGGTQAQVQIDLTKHLKLESTIGTGGTPATGATPDNDPGSSIGLTYQFEY